jgi:hypothetical protein
MFATVYARLLFERSIRIQSGFPLPHAATTSRNPMPRSKAMQCPRPIRTTSSKRPESRPV